jgi:hypothetical protein
MRFPSCWFLNSAERFSTIFFLFRFLGQSSACVLALYLLRRPFAVPNSLVATAGMLLKNMGLLFVPAGVGVIANLDPIRAQWFPILTGLMGSTILSLLATAYVMHWCSSRNLNPGSVHSLPAENQCIAS